MAQNKSWQLSQSAKKSVVKLVLMVSITLLILAMALIIGSVKISFTDLYQVLENQVLNQSMTDLEQQATILLAVRLPRLLTAFLIGMALSLSGMTMQSLLMNPLADGSTLGVSAGASLGAGIAIVIGIPSFIQRQGIFLMAVIFAFGSLVLILSFSYYLDKQLKNMTVILTGIVFTMLVSSLMNILMIISKEKLPSLVFWTLGSLSGSRYTDVWVMGVCVIIMGGYIVMKWQELNAFSMGENIARNIGINIVSVRIKLFIATSILIGVAVSIGGSIPFVGLITPHISRLIVGSNHRRLIPWTLFIGGNFMVVTDLLARTIASPLEIPIGAITSLFGSCIFILIFARGKRNA
ncbi:FecCD family ABC transporter permease [Facklamia sp. P12945]|uniref:FecCD family ABC transporter permease n=1 Tax=unclassified Facklamia TaxID=2622293 RepID=UPI003D186FD6